MSAIRRQLARISIRLLAFNILLVFLPASGILALKTYEDHLLDLQERSMVQQGRILAAALGERGALDAAEAEAILVNLRQQQEARLRVIDGEANLLADSSRLGPQRDRAAEDTRLIEPEARKRGIYRLGLFLYRLLTEPFLPPEPPTAGELPAYSRDGKLHGPEIDRALEGRYGPAVRRSPISRSLTLYSALPITSGGEVVGAVVVSRSTYRILQAIYDFRISTFGVILASVAAAAVLSLLVSTTIARPLRQLKRDAQALLDRRGRLRRRFHALERHDEIGDLSRALAELTRRLEGHLTFIESFAADVSHEFKNPLAAIRSATELLAEVDDPAERARFTDMVLGDVARLEHLLSHVREITQIDRELEDQAVEPVALEPLLASLIESFAMRAGNDVDYRLTAAEEPLAVIAAPERLSQVFVNLLDNATSFSPPGGRVEVTLARRGDHAEVRVRDRGPGIAEGHLDRVFTRFFSYRPRNGNAPRGDHTGLGLSIVKAIVEGYGGTVIAGNAGPDGTDGPGGSAGGRGAELVVSLPL